MKDDISKAYAFVARRRKNERERNSPCWKLAQKAAIDKLPLNGSGKEFVPPGRTETVFYLMEMDLFNPSNRDRIVMGPKRDEYEVRIAKKTATRHAEKSNLGYPLYSYYVVTKRQPT